MSAPIVVVGAGIGGLAAALDLALAGHEVEVIERADTPGGKLREVQVAGASMDAGPTVFTMRWVFDELLARAGTTLDAELDLRPASLLARHAWADGSCLDLFADPARSVDAIAALCGPREAQGFVDFSARAAEIYRTLEQPFLRSPRPNPLSLATRSGWRGLPALSRISPFQTLWPELARYFRDPRLLQLFGRYATYCGASPFLCPATLMLVAHVEQQGVWLIEGGMHRLARVLVRLAQARGVRLRFGAHVQAVERAQGRASGVRLATGERIAARAVLWNGDAAAVARALGRPKAHGRAPLALPKRSLSALTFHLHARSQGFGLAHHTVFFSRDSRAEFEDLFTHRRLPREPTVYACAQDRSDLGQLQDASAAERLFLIVNAPALGDAGQPDPSEIERCQAQTFQLLSRCGLSLTPNPPPCVRTTPWDFERLFPDTGGALYGQASHGWMASFRRPGSRGPIPGLYLAGGSTHPGPGLPMAALSGRLAARCLQADLASTRRSRPAAMPGGMSTR